MEQWLKGLISIILISQVIQLLFSSSESIDHLERITRLGIAIYLILFLSTFSHA